MTGWASWHEITADVIALATFAATAAYLFVTYKILESALRQNSLNERYSELNQRAWVVAGLTLQRCFSSMNGIEFVTVVSLTNVGHTPALGVEILPVVHTNIAGNDTAEQRGKFLRELHQHEDGLPGLGGAVIFPNQSQGHQYQFTLSWDDINFARNSYEGENTHLMLFPVVTLCVRYVYAESSKVHETVISYDVGGLSLEERNRLALNEQIELPRAYISSSFHPEQIVT